MLKRKFVFALLCAAGLALLWNKYDKPPARRSGAYEALQWQTIKRAYPNGDIPNAASYAAFEQARQMLQASALRKNSASTPWQTLGPHNRGGRTLALAFNPKNPNTIYAGAASGGLWRSFTAGRGALAWQRVPTGFPVLAVSSIAFAPNDSNTIYLGTGEVYNAQDARPGQVSRATRGTYGIGILKSRDGGSTWEKSLDWSYAQQKGVWAVKVHPLQPNVIWAATTDGTYKSDDAGQTWRRVHGVIMAMDLAVHPVDPNLAIVGCGNFSSAGYGLYRTTNGGLNWTKILAGVPTVYAGKTMLAIHPNNPNVVMASFGNGFEPGVDNRSWLSRSENAGATWSAATAPLVALRAGVFRTSDGGNSWINLTNNLPDLFPSDLALDPNNDQKVYLTFSGFGSSHVFKSSNGGATWEDIGGALPDIPTEAVTVDPMFPEHIYVGTDIGVFVSTDGGKTWQDFNEGFIDAVLVFDLSISARNRKLRVATHGSGVFERPLLREPISDVEPPEVTISGFSLAQNYPNPFSANGTFGNPQTSIAFKLPVASRVTLKVFDVNGREIVTLMNQQQKASGNHRVNFSSQGLASGVYYYRLEATPLHGTTPAFVETKAMTLMR